MSKEIVNPAQVFTFEDLKELQYEMYGALYIEIDGGMIQYTINEEGKCLYIEQFFVPAELRRTGVGQKLFDAAKKRARALGLTHVVGHVHLKSRLHMRALQALSSQADEVIHADNEKIVMRVKV